MHLLRAIARATIWHRSAIPADEWKFRSIKRVWLPLYNLIVVGAGLWALWFGSPILKRLFPGELIDIAGLALAVAGAICFLGRAFPMLWAVEFAGKVAIAFLLGGYAGTVALFRQDPDPAGGFVVFILVLAIIPCMIGVSIIAEEWKERWDLAKTSEAETGV